MNPRTFYLRCLLCGTAFFAAWEWALAVFLFDHLGLYGNSSPFAPWQTAVMLAFLAVFLIFIVSAFLFGRKHLAQWGLKQRLSLTGIILLCPVTGFALFYVLLHLWENVF